MIITAHQPNFMPWLPYFKKMQAADVFVIFTNCQWEKGGFQNRFSMHGKWHTLSVEKGLRPINEKKYVSPVNDWERIRLNLWGYHRVIDYFDDCIQTDLCETNIAIIQKIHRLLHLDTEIKYDYPTELTGTARVIDMCKRYGADTYLSGPDGANYLDQKQFSDAGISLRFYRNGNPSPIIERIADVF